MIIMGNDKRHIRELIEILVNPSKIIPQIGVSIGLMKTGNYISNNYQKGEVDENLLLRLLKISIHNERIKVLLPDILFHIEVCSITDAVVSFSLSYPGTFRDTLLCILAHLWLKPEHLEQINNCIHTPEAFCKLFLYYAEDDQYTEEQFYRFLDKNIHHLTDVDCYSLVERQHIGITESKLAVLNHVVSNESGFN